MFLSSTLCSGGFKTVAIESPCQRELYKYYRIWADLLQRSLRTTVDPVDALRTSEGSSCACCAYLLFASRGDFLCYKHYETSNQPGKDRHHQHDDQVANGVGPVATIDLVRRKLWCAEYVVLRRGDGNHDAGDDDTLGCYPLQSEHGQQLFVAAKPGCVHSDREIDKSYKHDDSQAQESVRRISHARQ